MSYINGFSSSCNLDNIEEMKLKCRRWGSREWDLLCEKHHYYVELSLVGSLVEVSLSNQVPTTSSFSTTEGRTDGRKDGRTDSWEHERQKRKKPQRWALLRRCVITPKKKQNPSFQDPNKKHKTRKHKIDEDDELQGFPANSRHISSSSSSSSSYYYYYY